MKHLLTLICIFIYTLTISAQPPAGYYQNTNNTKQDKLIDELNEIISNANFLRYGSGEGFTWEGFYHTDRNPVDNTVYDRYSDSIRYQTDFGSTEDMHIEHAFPKSWWGNSGIDAYKDLHHLYPADGITNINKSNLPLGIVGEASFDNGVSKIGETTIIGTSGRCFEPDDEYKGDFARAYFYVVTAYNETSSSWQSPMLNNNTYPTFKDWAINLLLEWHRNDPVSSLETERNNAIYKIQGNRNPFIDYPEIAEHVWGNKQNNDFVLPIITDPYFVYPNNWTKFNLGVNLVGSNIDTTFTIKGGNITSVTSIRLKNNSPKINVSKSMIQSNEANNGCALSIYIDSSEECEVNDVLIIANSGVDSIFIPINAVISSQFMCLPVENKTATTAHIEWMEVANSNQYEITIENGETEHAGDLIISGYIEGSGWNKAIELFNGTGETIDLSHYSLKKQNNGSGAFDNERTLSGTLNNGETFVLVHGTASDSLKAKADLITGSNEEDILAFNGNDAVALYHNKIIIDLVGIENQYSSWGQDLSMKRKASVIHPISKWDKNEWEKLPNNTISFLGNRVFTTENNATSQTITTTDNKYLLTDLNPRSEYIFSVKALPSNDISANKVRFITENVPSVEAYNATNIHQSGFTANWDPANEADAYLIDVFTLTTGDSIKTTVDFNDIGSNGKPLPSGWTGTASGRYTSTTSSGKSPNSISLKNTDEYIQTETFATPLNYVEFMYRFPSGASDSYLLIEGATSDGTFATIDTIKAISNDKTIARYDSLAQSFYAIKWSYNKDAGNLSIDDIEYCYNGLDSNYVITNQMSTDNVEAIYGLSSNTHYFYNVKVKIGDVVSAPSNTIAVTTNDIPSGNNCPTNTVKSEIVYVNNSTLHIDNIVENSQIMIYSINGILIKNITSQQNTQISINNVPRGVYLIKIVNHHTSSTHKVII